MFRKKFFHCLKSPSTQLRVSTWSSLKWWRTWEIKVHAASQSFSTNFTSSLVNVTSFCSAQCTFKSQMCRMNESSRLLDFSPLNEPTLKLKCFPQGGSTLHCSIWDRRPLKGLHWRFHFQTPLLCGLWLCCKTYVNVLILPNCNASHRVRKLAFDRPLSVGSM